MLKKDIVLEDGRLLRLEPLNGKEDAGEFMAFINALIKEKTYLLIDKPVTLKEEKQWLKMQLLAQKTGEVIILKALIDGILIGNGFAKPGIGRNQGNISLGIALAQQSRGKGIGRLLLEELIIVSDRKWHPKNITLHVVSANTKAQKLYESLGFCIIARLPQWYKYGATYLDEYILLLDKKRFYTSRKTSKIKKVIQEPKTKSHRVSRS